MRTEEGLLEVLDVETDSPAAAAGLKAGDVLVSFDGLAVRDKETLAKAMAAKRWGDAAELTVRRDGETVAVPVLLRRKPPGAQVSPRRAAQASAMKRSSAPRPVKSATVMPPRS